MRRAAARIGVARDHDHPEFDLRLVRELVPVLAVIFLHLGRRDDEVGCHVLGPHRLHDDLLPLQIAEFRHRIFLRLHRLDEGVTVATEVVFDHLVHPLVDEVRRNRELLLVESLDDELAIDQVLERRFPQLGDFVHQLLAGILRAEQALARFDDFSHLGIGDDFVIHDRCDAIDRFRAARGRSGRRHSEAGECEKRDGRITPDEV